MIPWNYDSVIESRRAGANQENLLLCSLRMNCLWNRGVRGESRKLVAFGLINAICSVEGRSRKNRNRPSLTIVPSPYEIRGKAALLFFCFPARAPKEQKTHRNGATVLRVYPYNYALHLAPWSGRTGRTRPSFSRYTHSLSLCC